MQGDRSWRVRYVADRMLFNSVDLFLFLPGVLAIYGFAGQAAGPTGALRHLFAASLFFYGWWENQYSYRSCLISYLLQPSFGLMLASARRVPHTADQLIRLQHPLKFGKFGLFQIYWLFDRYV